MTKLIIRQTQHTLHLQRPNNMLQILGNRGRDERLLLTGAKSVQNFLQVFKISELIFKQIYRKRPKNTSK